MNKQSFAVIGGDRRSVLLARLLAKDGYAVFSSGHGSEEAGTAFADPVAACEKADAVILPLPAFSGGNISAPLSDCAISFDRRLQDALDGKTVFGGMLPPELCAAGWYDYAKNESFLIKNAQLTAEAALAVMISELPFSLMNCRVLVTGYGRIAKLLCPMLVSIGARVTAAARKAPDRAFAEAAGIRAADFDCLANEITDYCAVVNTVPSVVLDGGLIRRMDGRCVIFDLASRPGGVDAEAAVKNGIRLVRALSLPGKYSPVSAAGAIKDTVLSVLMEEGK